MPRTRVVFYQERKGSVPVLEWLDTLPAKIQDKCVVKIERLRERGHELRRPEADLLRNGIYELRIGREGMNYRILYFFHGRMAAVRGPRSSQGARGADKGHSSGAREKAVL